MIDAFKRRTNIGIGIGFLGITAAGFLVRHDSTEAHVTANLVAVCGAGFWVWGCAQYAKGKGHSAWWGALGLLNIFGLIILFLLPDRRAE